MHILVTGLKGFTGSYLHRELLSHGHSVTGLQADLMDIQAVCLEVKTANPQAVIHLAAIACVGHHDANAFYRVNVVGTRNLLVALEAYAPQLKSGLLVSSAQVYGHLNQDLHVSDSSSVLSVASSPLNPCNDYAVSKLAMEHMSRLWSDRLPLLIVRPFNYTGVGQSEQFLIPKIVAHFRAKTPTISLGNLDVWREFGDVRAIVSAYRQLIENTSAGETIDICTGQAYALQEVIDLAEAITGHKIKVKINPAFVRENEIRLLTGNNDRLMALINWTSPTLKETLQWMLEVNRA